MSKQRSSSPSSLNNLLFVGICLVIVGAVYYFSPFSTSTDSGTLGNTIEPGTSIPLGNAPIQQPSQIQGSQGIPLYPSHIQGNDSNPQSALKLQPGELEGLNF